MRALLGYYLLYRRIVSRGIALGSIPERPDPPIVSLSPHLWGTAPGPAAVSHGRLKRYNKTKAMERSALRWGERNRGAPADSQRLFMLQLLQLEGAASWTNTQKKINTIELRTNKQKYFCIQGIIFFFSRAGGSAAPPIIGAAAAAATAGPVVAAVAEVATVAAAAFPIVLKATSPQEA